MKDLPKDALDFIVSLIPGDPEKALSRVLPKLRYVEARASQPTVDQIKLLRTLEPYTSSSIAEIRQKLIGGTLRLGPFHRSFGSGRMRRKLESVGLEVTVRPLTNEELLDAKLVDLEVPDYFRTPPEPK